jgi:DNA polymerase-3 subunit delta
MAARRGRRAIPPGAQLSEVRRRLKQGWPAGLTVLIGDDAYHMDRAQRALLETLAPGGPSDFALTLFGEDKVDLSVVVSAARSVGMFAERRVVFVRDAGLLEGEPEGLLEYAGNPPAESYLLVRAASLDQRRKLHKALATAGQTLRFEVPDFFDPGKLIAEVGTMARERGVALENDAAALLAQLHGTDLYRVAAELEKLRAWSAGASERIDVARLRELVSSGGLISGWEVADAVVARDRAAGLTAARRLVDGGDEPIRIVGGLAWRARLMLKAKALLEAGQDPGPVVRRAWGFQDAMARGLHRYSLSELLQFPAKLARADRKLKSRSIDSRAVLEELVDDLTGLRHGAARAR